MPIPPRSRPPGPPPRSIAPKFSDGNDTFCTGAKRGSQAGKPRPDLTSPYAALRKGVINAYGAEHYGDRNWERGMQFSRVLASIERHLMAYKMGLQDEDHLGQLGWNVDALLHFEEVVKRGLLPKELDDLPRYESGVTSISDDPFQQQMYDRLVDYGCLADVARVIALGISVPEHADAPAHMVYISGRMRGVDQLNFPAFDAARDRFLRQGWYVISPADIDRIAGGSPHHTDEQLLPTTDYAYRDFFALYLVADTSVGAVAMLPQWEGGVGAPAEFFISRWTGLMLLDALTCKPLSTFNWGMLRRAIEKSLSRAS